MSQPLNLTFGIELEFIAVYPRFAFNNQHPNLVPIEDEEVDRHITAGHALHFFLNAANIPASGWEPPGTFHNVEEYSTWSVTEDALVLSEDEIARVPDGYIIEPIEISSRILRLFQDDWRGEIRTVLDVMAWMKRHFKCNFYTNDTTGFHVHVGNGKEKMPFDTVKRIFQLATAHERVFDSLHASSRILAPVEYVSGDSHLLYAPLSFFHGRGHLKGELVKDPTTGMLVAEPIKKKNIFGWLRQIEFMDGFEDFTMFFDGRFQGDYLSGHSSAVNFDNLFSDTQEDVNNTVEFRQHVGTLDYAEIVAWVSLLAKFVDFCHRANDTQIICLALRATEVEFGAAEFMRLINCDEELIQHYAFDGEAATIGELPRPGREFFTQQVDLESLTEQNDDEVSENTDRARVKRLVNQKLASQYYGFDSALGLLPLRYEKIQDMLRQANERVTGRIITFEDSRWPGGPSEARSLVLRVLSDMYDQFDPTLGLRQPALVEPLGQLYAVEEEDEEMDKA